MKEIIERDEEGGGRERDRETVRVERQQETSQRKSKCYVNRGN